jgi:AcrR family transcriptional regulator
VSPTESPAPRRVGRPPRIDREAIARAALDIGLDQVTMKRVAAKLGMSVAGLYHHVRGRDELMKLAFEQSLSEMPLPEDHGQHWTEWLREWARHTRTAMASQPELVQRYTSGSISSDRVVEAIGRVLEVLHRSGFEPPAAMAAFRVVANVAVGSAIDDIREAEAIDVGSPVMARMHAVLARLPSTELPTLRSLVASGYVPDSDQDFEDRLTTVLTGIAACNDLPMHPDPG